MLSTPLVPKGSPNLYIIFIQTHEKKKEKKLIHDSGQSNPVPLFTSERDKRRNPPHTHTKKIFSFFSYFILNFHLTFSLLLLFKTSRPPVAILILKKTIRVRSIRALILRIDEGHVTCLSSLHSSFFHFVKLQSGGLSIE
jgi:hypothetical protein